MPAYLRTWTGRLLIINSIVFVALVIVSKSVFDPSPEFLIKFGAKSSLHIALGEWWRFVTPIFLHIGIVHFALNYLALKFIGRNIEELLGSKLFLGTYLLTGIAGNIASAYANLSLAAGASGSIFGLIGVGVAYELVYSWKQRKMQKFTLGPYTYTALVNYGIFFAINFVISVTEIANIGIDNAAHTGGLLAGMAVGLMHVYLRNRRYLPAGVVAVVLLACVGAGGLYAGSPRHVESLLLDKAAHVSSPQARYYFLSQAILLNPVSPDLRIMRAELLLKHGAGSLAKPDLEFLKQQYPEQFQQFQNNKQ